MAFGIQPKYIRHLAPDDLTVQQFLVVSIAAAKELDWNIGNVYENGFDAYTTFSMSSWSEELKIRIENDRPF